MGNRVECGNKRLSSGIDGSVGIVHCSDSWYRSGGKIAYDLGCNDRLRKRNWKNLEDGSIDQEFAHRFLVLFNVFGSVQLVYRGFRACRV